MPSTMSPLRYPGGKTQLYSFICNSLEQNNVDGTYIEPFAGGAGLPIKLLVNNKVKRVWINDFDKSIYSIWYSILHYPSDLKNLINSVPFDYSGSSHSDDDNLKYWNEIKLLHDKKKSNPLSILNAFSTLMLNRLNVSGIINGGPIGGKLQNKTKIYVRFNKKTLCKKIDVINKLKDRIKLTNLDAIKMISSIPNEVSNKSNTFIFFDPPYFKQGKNLYMSFFNYNDHKTLASKIMRQDYELNWIVTYDKSDEISILYKNLKNKYEYFISYSANNKNRGKAPEFLFASENTKIESYENIILE
ncbi:DNA adenine methylase (plasmid) [Nicoliella spurrieriana]|uniref:DNA adenine methylase n=1 Tax=Nicoliella spurrieriana TaxID=2925830 RepID=A0A976RQT4_9LACO|nr:DNA adenine methylase [Nicoliella spurrieriana]UQS86172.1 DNA adenine methylase [Nicoliella spurrieriana]